MRLIFVTASVLAATLGAQPALAGPANDALVTEFVSYADLDLTLKADRAKLERRVRSTIKRFCPGVQEATPAPPSTDPKCFQAKLKEVRVQMDRAFAQADRGPSLAAARPSKSHR